jgi:hypothetical protein
MVNFFRLDAWEPSVKPWDTAPAMAFVEEKFNESGSNTPNSKTTVEGSLVKARKVLAERPDSAQLGRLIDAKLGLTK